MRSERDRFGVTQRMGVAHPVRLYAIMRRNVNARPVTARYDKSL